MICVTGLYYDIWDCHFRSNKWFYHFAYVHDVYMSRIPIHYFILASVGPLYVRISRRSSPLRFTARRLYGHSLSRLRLSFSKDLEDLYTKYCWCVLILVENILIACTTSSLDVKICPSYIDPASACGDTDVKGIQGLAAATSAHVGAFSNSGAGASMYMLKTGSVALASASSLFPPH